MPVDATLDIAALRTELERTARALGFEAPHEPVTAVQLSRGKAEAELLFQLALALQDTAGSWLSLTGQLNRPGGAVAARCDFSFTTATGASFDGWLDATRFTATGGLFSDGFESGDTSAWSATVP